MRRPLVDLFLALLFITAVAPCLYSQAISGDLYVSVTDPTGAPVAGASLELVNKATGLRQKAQTDVLGGYLFVQLPPGVYTLVVSMEGFQTATLNDVLIRVGQKSRVDVSLKLGAVTESITVSAAAATLLEAESATIGQVITNESIVELPLNGRNFVQLAQLSAGAVPIGIGNSPATAWTGRRDSTLSIAGGRESNNSFLVNGIETRNSRFGSAGIRPSVEAIQEFRVLRSTYGAEYGRSAAIINTTLRSGTNDLRFSIFEFLRNRVLDANNFFANRAGRPKPAFSQNNFGTAVGGPVVLPGYNGKDKTFWFFNYEGFRQREGRTLTGLYPSRAQLAGNLADDSAGTGIYPTGSDFCKTNPKSRKCADVIDPFSGLVFPGNVIPASRLDPITQKAVQFIPEPNVAVTPGSPNFPNFNTAGSPKFINDWDQFNVRIDHYFTANDIVYGTFSDSDEKMHQPALQPFGGEDFPQSDRLYTVTYNKVISPTLINEFRFGFNRSTTYRQAETAFVKDFAREVFGLKNTSPNPFDWGCLDLGSQVSAGWAPCRKLSVPRTRTSNSPITLAPC